LKDATRKETAKQEIVRTNENGKVNGRLEKSAQYTNTLAE
jgi:hypothetical protein